MRGLSFYNGFGGFAPDGREYVIVPSVGRRPPAPWVNVLANPRFGTVVSESGSSYTWCENAHELRLTPWHNDPVTDVGGEAIYLRDEESGEVWHPTSLPSPGDERDDSDAPPYLTRHGFGYSVFEHDEAGIHSELTMFVAIDAAVKFSVLELRNDSGRARSLSATGYVEWVLGDMRAKAEEYDVFTNAGPAAPLRAPGHSQGAFGIESAMDELAAKLGIDPVELRRKNEASPVRLAQYDAGAKAIGWERRNKKAGDMSTGGWGAAATARSGKVRGSRDGERQLVRVRLRELERPGARAPRRLGRGDHRLPGHRQRLPDGDDGGRRRGARDRARGRDDAPRRHAVPRGARAPAAASRPTRWRPR